jgi:endonuclease-3
LEANLKKDAAWFLKSLKKTYPNAHCELDHTNPFELMIATILSAQCTDKRVNIVTKKLFEEMSEPSEYAKAPLSKIEKLVHSTGFYRNKAKNIKANCKILIEEYGGQVPQTMEELVALPGVGRKTANVILGNAFGKSEGVVVDTHVSRISQLLGLTKAKTPEKIEKDLIHLFPRKSWTLLSHLLIWHGRACCVARRPRCIECTLKKRCSFVVEKAA